jgi:DNA repair protein RadC
MPDAATWQPATWSPGLREASAAPPVPPRDRSAGEPGTVDARTLAVAAQGLEYGLGQPAEKPPRRARAPNVLPFTGTGPEGHRQRLRERLLDRGEAALDDYELLEMLLFFAIPKGDTKPLAKALMLRFGGFANVLAAPRQVLLATSGLGVHSVAALKLVQEASLRMIRAEIIEQPVLNRWDRLIEYLTAAMARESIEQFRVLFLDTKNRLIADEAQARGTVNHTPVYPREVVKRALDLHATALILVHNHPSGDPTPSRADIEMTGEVKRAALALGIALHDHIIVGKGRSLSFRAEGLL